MTNPDEIKRFGSHDNAFGFLRLLFASLVIVAHVPEGVDGNDTRELVHQIFPTSFGTLAVNGFFVISGYLICGSYLSSPSLRSYLGKRVLRIYPAFVVASLVSVLIVAPLAGGRFEHGPLRAAVQTIVHLVILCRPTIHGAFADQHGVSWATALNGAMWTIQYEFACYIVLAGLGIVGLLRRRATILAIALLLLTCSGFLQQAGARGVGLDELFPGPGETFPRLIGLFLAGSCFYLFRDRVTVRRPLALIAAVLFLISLKYKLSANLGFGVFGGYVIFYVALYANLPLLRRINNKTDISYGVYLYANPIERLLIMYLGSGSLLLLGLTTWLFAVACGWVSWSVVEKPAMDWLRRRRASRVTLVPA